MVYILQLFSKYGRGLRNPRKPFRGNQGQIVLIMLQKCDLPVSISSCFECGVGSPRATMTWSLSGLNAKGNLRIQLSSSKADTRGLQKHKATPLFSLNLNIHSLHKKMLLIFTCKEYFTPAEYLLNFCFNF